MNEHQWIVQESENGLRVDIFLSQILEKTRSFIKEQSELIEVNHVVVKQSYKLKTGDAVHFIFQEKQNDNPKLIAEKIPLEILFEDEHLMIVNKPAGMVVHPAKGNWTGTLANAVAYHLKIQENHNLRLGIVHRLDKDTSGLMIIAKHEKSQFALMQAFKDRKIIKIYHALVNGHLRSSYGQWEDYIHRDPHHKMLYHVSDKGKYASLEYQVLEELKKVSLVKIRIHTGRTHQIRVQFKARGHILVGDSLYGSLYHHHPLCLVATKIIFMHPIGGEKMKFEIPFPSYFEKEIQFFD